MKKILLGLGATSLTILPLVAMVSCSSSIENNELSIELLSNQTTVTQETITSTITKIKNVEITDEEKISALSNVFIGINVDNLNDFEISFGANEKEITLTGILENNRQNIFPTSTTEDKKELTAKASSIPTKDLGISLKANITQTDIDSAVSIIGSTTIIIEEYVGALNLVFDGIKTSDFPVGPDGMEDWGNYMFSFSNDDPKTITLIASPDYFFAGDPTITILKAIPSGN